MNIDNLTQELENLIAQLKNDGILKDDEATVFRLGFWAGARALNASD